MKIGLMALLLSLMVLPILTFAGNSTCVNDGVCTYSEYLANCPDCLVHNITYPNMTSVATHTGFNIPLWAWLLIAVVIILIIITIVVGYVIYVMWKKRGKL